MKTLVEPLTPQKVILARTSRGPGDGMTGLVTATSHKTGAASK